MTITMATYRRTLRWTKRNTTPNTRRMFAVGVSYQTMDVTDVERLGGTPLSVAAYLNLNVYNLLQCVGGSIM